MAASKGAELFLSDTHGEYEAFAHVLRSAAGLLDARIGELFGDRLTEEEKRELAATVCYPNEKLDWVRAHEEDPKVWCQTTLDRMGELLRNVTAGCSKEELQARIPVCEDGNVLANMATAIQRSLVSRVHLLGDVYDRGPAPELIMEELMAHHSVDIVWGNHDIVWMGAALGQAGCIAHVVRNCARYGNLDVLADAYGIDLSSLLDFAQRAYADDPCVGFGLKGGPEGNAHLTLEEYRLNVQVQKAMAILQFKVEARLIDENPSFGLEDRKLLDKIDFDRFTIVVDGVEYPLTDTVFPTVDVADPNKLTDEEARVVEQLCAAFQNCDKLRRHMDFLLEKGALYRISDSNLMYHACVPMNADGTCKDVTIFGQTLRGKGLFDAVDGWVREAFTSTDEASRKRGCDALWYLWLGEGSPLFAKSKMATFEIYYVADKAARKEVKNAYYSLLEDEAALANIFADFGMGPATSRILSGHVPVKVKAGEDPVKCGGKALIIDGGMSRAYQKTTGIAGFVLVSDEQGSRLCSLEPFAGKQAAVEANVGLGMTAREL